MRLIDVDELKADYHMADDCKDCETGYRSCEYDRIYSKMDFCGWLDDAPTVDAVEVVRCRDCKYARMTVKGECKYCDIWSPDEAAYMDGDYYCASGERKDGNDGKTD